MTNGENHASALATNEMHKWTLTASAGDAIVLSVAKVGDTSHLHAAAGALYRGWRVAGGVFRDADRSSYVSAPATTTLCRLRRKRRRHHPERRVRQLSVDAGQGAWHVRHTGRRRGRADDEWRQPSWLHLSRRPGSVDVHRRCGGRSEPQHRRSGGRTPPSRRGFDCSGPTVRSWARGSVSWVARSMSRRRRPAPTRWWSPVRDATYSATGSYLLTLVKRGPFVVPSNDEGGPMTNGVVYRGTITRADLDPWAFMATGRAAAGHHRREGRRLPGILSMDSAVRALRWPGHRLIRRGRGADHCRCPGDRPLHGGRGQRG